MRKRILVATPIVLAALLIGGHVARHHMTGVAAEALRDEARTRGMALDWADLSVSLTGRIELLAVVLTHEELGRVTIPRATLSVDILESLDGDVHLSEVVLERPRLQLSDALLEPLCAQAGLCSARTTSRSTQRGRPLSEAEIAALLDRLALRPGPSPESAEVPFDRLRVDGLRMEISSRGRAPYLAVYQLDLVLEPRGDALHMSGMGRLMSVFVRGDSVPFALAASMSRANLGLEVALPGSLELATPAGSLSFDEVSLSVGEQADVRLGKVVVLPHLLDVTQAWQADSVAATLSLSSGIVPEAVVVEGLKGELDLVALSDLASWLAIEAEAEAGDTALSELASEMADLRDAINLGLSDVRGSLYGTSVTVLSEEGDVRLTYRDGTTVSLARLNLDIGPGTENLSTRVLVTYEGLAAQAEQELGVTRGSVEVPLRSLTPGRIADWTQ